MESISQSEEKFIQVTFSWTQVERFRFSDVEIDVTNMEILDSLCIVLVVLLYKQNFKMTLFHAHGHAHVIMHSLVKGS